MVDQWVTRYQAGESLKQIAGEDLSPVTVFLHLRKRGIKLRDKVEAQIQAVTKYDRRPFSGDEIEKAYLMGLRYGDLHVVRHGRAIRVRVSTTRPAMADLFESLFKPYGHVARYPRKAKLVDFEWTLECDLDSSFSFLLTKPTIAELEKLSRAEMIAFLAGLFDAEGSIFLHIKRGRYNPEVTFSGTEDNLLEYVKSAIGILGLRCKLSWAIQQEDRQGVMGYSREGRVAIWRFRDVQEFLRVLPIRHWEKVTKARLVLKMQYRSDSSKNIEDGRVWQNLITRIRRDRLAFVDLARQNIEASVINQNSVA